MTNVSKWSKNWIQQSGELRGDSACKDRLGPRKWWWNKIPNELYTPEMQIGRRGLGSPQCSLLNTVSPFFREGNLREHLGKPPVKNELLLKRRSLEETAAKLNTGFRGRFLNENVKTRFLPSGAAMGMGKFEFPGALDHWLRIRPHQAFAFHSLTKSWKWRGTSPTASQTALKMWYKNSTPGSPEELAWLCAGSDFPAVSLAKNKSRLWIIWDGQKMLNEKGYGPN